MSPDCITGYDGKPFWYRAVQHIAPFILVGAIPALGAITLWYEGRQPIRKLQNVKIERIETLASLRLIPSLPRPHVTLDEKNGIGKTVKVEGLDSIIDFSPEDWDPTVKEGSIVDIECNATLPVIYGNMLSGISINDYVD